MIRIRFFGPGELIQRVFRPHSTIQKQVKIPWTQREGRCQDCPVQKTTRWGSRRQPSISKSMSASRTDHEAHCHSSSGRCRRAEAQLQSSGRGALVGVHPRGRSRTREARSHPSSGEPTVPLEPPARADLSRTATSTKIRSGSMASTRCTRREEQLVSPAGHAQHVSEHAVHK